MKHTRLILAILLIIAFSVFAIASGESETSTVDQGSGTASQGSGAAESAAESATEDNTDIGKYSVVIDSCRLAKDYSGKDVVIIKYIFTNKSDEDPAAFYTAFSDNVYQGGVGLNGAYVFDDDVSFERDNKTKKIKKGASIEVEVAYELNDTETDIEVEVKELFSFDDKTLTKTFSIK